MNNRNVLIHILMQCSVIVLSLLICTLAHSEHPKDLKSEYCVVTTEYEVLDVAQNDAILYKDNVIIAVSANSGAVLWKKEYPKRVLAYPTPKYILVYSWEDTDEGTVAKWTLIARQNGVESECGEVFISSDQDTYFPYGLLWCTDGKACLSLSCGMYVLDMEKKDVQRVNKPITSYIRLEDSAYAIEGASLFAVDLEGGDLNKRSKLMDIGFEESKVAIFPASISPNYAVFDMVGNLSEPGVSHVHGMLVIMDGSAKVIKPPFAIIRGVIGVGSVVYLRDYCADLWSYSFPKNEWEKKEIDEDCIYMVCGAFGDAIICGIMKQQDITDGVNVYAALLSPDGTILYKKRIPNPREARSYGRAFCVDAMVIVKSEIGEALIRAKLANPVEMDRG